MTPDENTPMNPEYERYGPEWQAEVCKQPKAAIARMASKFATELAAKEEALNHPPDWERVKLLYQADPEMVFDEDYGWLHVAVQGEIRELEKQAASSEGLRAEIARIADDFHPSNDREAALALSEMRQALMGLVENETPSPWRGIDTHDKSRRAVLMWCPQHQNIYEVCWRSEEYLGDPGWFHFSGHGDRLREAPTHWMPLPQPPADGREGDQS